MATISTFFDAVYVNATESSGHGPFTLGTALTGFQTAAAAGITNGTPVSYRATDGTNWETAHGIVDVSGSTYTLARGIDTIKSSNSNALVNFSSGVVVLITLLSQDINALVSTLAAQAFSAAQETQGRQNVYAAPFDALAYNGMQINGSAEVTQINGTNAITGTGYVVDGIEVQANGPSFSAVQSTDAPLGYLNSIKVSITTGDASPAAGDYLFFHIPIEGYRTARLAFGTVSAQPLSIGFWIRANRTGTYSGAIRNSAVNRSYVFSFPVSASATWQFITVTIPGDTAGTWLTGTNVGLSLEIAMMCGTTFAGAANIWSAAGDIAVTGTTNGAAATTDYTEITGIIVLPGLELPNSTRASFIMRPFTEELPKCQRYYQAYFGGASNNLQIQGYTAAGGYIVYPLIIPPMRVAPTAAIIGSWSLQNTASGPVIVTTPTNIIMYIQATATGGLSALAGSAAVGFSLSALL